MIAGIERVEPDAAAGKYPATFNTRRWGKRSVRRVGTIRDRETSPEAELLPSIGRLARPWPRLARNRWPITGIYTLAEKWEHFLRLAVVPGEQIKYFRSVWHVKALQPSPLRRPPRVLHFH